MFNGDDAVALAYSALDADERPAQKGGEEDTTWLVGEDAAGRDVAVIGDGGAAPFGIGALEGGGESAAHRGGKDDDGAREGNDEGHAEGHNEGHHEHHHGHGLTSWEIMKFNSSESLDYQIMDTEPYRVHLAKQHGSWARNKTLYKWITQFFIGAFTGTVAFCIGQAVDEIEEWKFDTAQDFIDDERWIVAYVVFLITCASLIIISSALVVFIQPAAAGSGIPEVKAYLNGIRVAKAFNIKTLVLKIVGVICSVSSGLAVGPEGPMIHTGAIIGAGVSQGKSKTLKFNVYKPFQNDRDKRDFISAGAAAGVSAAFNAPIGGILFSLEEISSFWAIDLTWQSFFGCMVAVYTSNFFSNGVGGGATRDAFGHFGAGTFILFRVSEDHGYWYPEVLCFIILGAIGGASGALFNRINRRISLFRRDYLRKKRIMRVIEATFICMITVSVSFWLPLAWKCQEVEKRFDSAAREPVKFNCPEGHYNPFATLFFTGQENAIRHLFSRHTTNEFGYESLVVFCVLYFVFAVVTAGMTISSGLVVPMLVIGGTYGRILGHLMHHLVPSAEIDAGTYAMVGASSFLGGVSRMTVSFSVIMLEITNDIEFLLPIMLVFMVSKWVGDLFSHPLYDMLLEVKCLPALEWAPPHLFRKHPVRFVMSPDPICFREMEEVGTVIDVLSTTSHNGFPVIDIGPDGDRKTFLGVVLRRHLLTVLKRKLFQPSPKVVSVRDATFGELRYTPPPISKVAKRIALEEREMFINIAPYVNRTTFTANEQYNLEIVYVFFRTVGMRHLVVVDNHNQVVGMITRKDLYEHLLLHRLGHPKRAMDFGMFDDSNENGVEMTPFSERRHKRGRERGLLDDADALMDDAMYMDGSGSDSVSGHSSHHSHGFLPATGTGSVGGYEPPEQLALKSEEGVDTGVTPQPDGKRGVADLQAAPVSAPASAPVDVPAGLLDEPVLGEVGAAHQPRKEETTGDVVDGSDGPRADVKDDDHESDDFLIPV